MISFSSAQQASQDPQNTLNGSNHLKQTHQRAASYIQKWWRQVANQKMTHLLSTAISYQVNEQKSFKETSSAIQNPTVISSTQKLLSLIDRKTARLLPAAASKMKEMTSVKVFLSAFLIVNHSEETLDNKQEKDKALLDAAKEMIDMYAIVCALLSSNAGESVAQKLINFSKSHSNYFEKFTERQVDHKSRETLGLIGAYLKMESLRNKITANNPRSNQRKIFHALTHSQKNIFDKIYSFAGNEGLDLLYKHLEVLSAQKNDQMTDILCDETMQTYYEMAINPNFEFSYTPNSSFTEKIVADTQKAAQSGNFSHLIAYLLGIRKRIIEIIPHATTFAGKLRQELNPAILKDIIPRLSDPNTFQPAFLYLANVIHQMESIEHNNETDVWTNEVLQKVQGGQNPFSLLAEIFRTIHNKIDQISVEYKNTILRSFRDYWKKEATRRLKSHFEARLDLYDLQLNKTKAWVNQIVENADDYGLKKEMLCSENAASHFIAAALLNQLHASTQRSEKELIDKLLIVRFLPPYNKAKLYKITINAICLELFRHIVRQFNGKVYLNELKGLHNALSAPIDERPINHSDIAKIVVRVILNALKKQTITVANPEQLLQKIQVSLSSTSRVYKIVSQSIKRRLKSFLIYPETLLMEKTRINQIKNQLHAIKMNAICLEIFYSTIQEAKCAINLEEIESLHSNLAAIIEADPSNMSDISDVFMTALKSIFKKNNKSCSSFEIIKSTLKNALIPSHRIYQAVTKRIDEALKLFLYKGILPENIRQHVFYRLLPLEKIGETIREISMFNLAIHKERYNKFIKASLQGDLFEHLNKPQLIENYPVLLKNEAIALKNIHDKIAKVALVAASLTLIRKQVWHSTPYIWQNDKPMPFLSDSEMDQLIEEYKVKRLLDPTVSSSNVYILMEKLLDDVLDDKKIILSKVALKKAQQMLKDASNFLNMGYRSFHYEIVNMIRSPSEEGLIPMTKNTLKFFAAEINDIGVHLQQLMKRATVNAAVSQEELPFTNILPKKIKAGPEPASKLRF